MESKKLGLLSQIYTNQNVLDVGVTVGVGVLVTDDVGVVVLVGV